MNTPPTILYDDSAVAPFWYPLPEAMDPADFSPERNSPSPVRHRYSACPFFNRAMRSVTSNLESRRTNANVGPLPTFPYKGPSLRGNPQSHAGSGGSSGGRLKSSSVSKCWPTSEQARRRGVAATMTSRTSSSPPKSTSANASTASRSRRGSLSDVTRTVASG